MDIYKHKITTKNESTIKRTFEKDYVVPLFRAAQAEKDYVVPLLLAAELVLQGAVHAES